MLDKSSFQIITDQFIIVRALHSDELKPANSSLDVLGNKLQETFNCKYKPELICKTRHIAHLKYLRKPDRVTELRNAYSFTDTSDFSGKPFLIIDDILTTGATLRAIGEAITNARGIDRISYFTLAYCDYTLDLNRKLELRGESYSWQKSSGWLAAEPDEGYNEINNLKVKIDADFGNHLVKKRGMHR